MALALDGSGHANGSGASLTVGLTTTNATDVIVLFILRNGVISSTAVSDNSGVTAAWAARFQAAGGGSVIEEWWTTSTGVLSAATITVTFTGTAPTFVTLDAFGVSGANTSSPWDGTNVNGPGDPLTISTTHANTMVIGGFRQNSTGSPTAGAGYTKISGANFQLAEYQIFSSTQTSLSVTDGATGDANGGVADAIVAASGGATFANSMQVLMM